MLDRESGDSRAPTGPTILGERSPLSDAYRPDRNQRGLVGTPLECHDWPGNVRELQDVIEHALITSRGKKFPLNIFKGAHYTNTQNKTGKQNRLKILSIS